ncbi:ketoacyl-synt-domain-containing protein [Schizophyllum commune H4-8]|uniref:Uncharacterized protein n=1 Tax=Schizophyllum commune (strain H4-8 / FGSC 9210) TaxID=578458 RepID=D8PMJ7_SCHCM|nr:ketoacyl-synt-domain-containing protein [Schizophyllum commune H4-8]KAI5898805.1 ketoacyl-synt-domain-containing protein [Schizophyllum commune H4-8]
MRLIILGGQGAASANSPSLHQRAQGVARTSAGRLLLAACHDAFSEELLSTSTWDTPDIHTNAFSTADALLAIPAGNDVHNAILSMTRTCLIQSLLLLEWLESSKHRTTDSPAVILPFSSGILAAYALSAARNIPSFITYVVDAFKIAFWIGYRVHRYRQEFLTSHDVAPSLPWSLVVAGLTLAKARRLLEICATDLPSLSITAITDTTCITISGHPDDLLFFKQHHIPSHCTTHDPGLSTLYHFPLYATALHDEVLQDLRLREVDFPAFAALRIPIRSAATSDVLDDPRQDAMDAILRSITVLPVNWLETVDRQLLSIPPESEVEIINVGPGGGLARAIKRRLGKRARLVDICESAGQAPDPIQEPIAIVGMAVHVPGARAPDELWTSLENGMNMVSSIPEARFMVSNYTGAANSSTRKMRASMGNFIDGADEFDAAFFGISPREARSMDPQQRILLQTAYEALESAGYIPDATPTSLRETFGCYIGAATNDYVQNLRHEIDVCYSSGTLQSFLSGRISYALKLGGPSVVYDTACSSSLVAIHAACRAIANGDCTAALAGGVNIITSPDMFIGLDRAHMLSHTGQCKSFDVSADGYCRGEGSAMFVLKKLSDALAEQDAILGIIRGVEINHSGRAPSITHPHADAQAALFRRLMSTAGMSSSRVGVVEAHGTGTQAGDPTEMKSIREVFATGQQLRVTSVKANIGHLEAASGAAGVAKVLMMFKHKKVPPQISLKILNPRIEPMEGSGMEISTRTTDWDVDEGATRVAVVNNFGIAGSNATLLLEEYVSPDDGAADVDGRKAHIFGVSAKTEGQLEERRDALLRWLRDPASRSISLSDIAYTLTARSQIHHHRLAVYASSREELCARLSGASVRPVVDAKEPTIFVFSGQGGQYLGMGKQLYGTSTVFRRVVDDCERILLGSGLTGAKDVVVGSLHDTTPRAETEAYQAATFVLECGLLEMYKSWGIVPDAVVGHSLGEYVALVAAGVLKREDALYIVGKRARLMATACDVATTGMVAVKYPPIDVQSLIELDFADSLSIACYNGPSECVVAGPVRLLGDFLATLKARGIPCVRLEVPFGFHSQAMTPIVDDLDKVCEGIALKPPSISIASNVLGTIVPTGDTTTFTSTYFSRHCREPVQFHDNIHGLLHSAAYLNAIWIELGPHSTSLPMVRSCAGTSGATPLCLASLRRKEDPWSTMSAALSQLYTTNTPVRWRAVFADMPHVRNVPFLPPYPFAKDRYWVPFREDAISVPSSLSSISHPTLRDMCRAAGPAGPTTFSVPIRDLKTLIEGHTVGSWPLYPASLYFEQIYAAVTLTLSEGTSASVFVVRDVKFQRALVLQPEEQRKVVVDVTSEQQLGTVRVSSSSPFAIETLHASAEYRIEDPARVLAAFERHSPILRFSLKAITGDPGGRNFDKESVYKLFARVVNYSAQYQAVETLRIAADGLTAVAIVKIDDDDSMPSAPAHPIFLDAMLHVPGFLCNVNCDKDDVYICTNIGKVVIAPALDVLGKDFQVYAIIDVRDDGTACATSYALLDGSTTLVAKVSDIVFRKVKLQALHKTLAMPLEARPLTNVPAVATSDCAAVAAIIGEVLGIPAERLIHHTDLHDYGLDSLTSIEARHLFKLRCNVQLPVDFFVAHRTIRQIAAYLDTCVPQRNLGPNAETLQPRLIQQPFTGELDPLILIHDGSGLIDYYERLPPMDRQIWGIPSPTGNGTQSLTDMAASYAQFIGMTFTVPVILGGWSFGGVVAYEAACLLAAQGVAVRGVILIDSPSPSGHVPLSPEVIEVAIGLNGGVGAKTLRPLLEAQFARNARLLAEYEPARNRVEPRLAFLRCRDGFSSPSLTKGVPLWLADRSDDNQEIVGAWESHVGSPMKVWDIPGHHFEPFLPKNIAAASVALREACCYLAQADTWPHIPKV